jgi:hypothetical protein
MEVLINHLLKSGARRNRLEAKVFGGRGGPRQPVQQPRRHAQCRIRARLPGNRKNTVVAKDLLDSYPRKVYYFPTPAGRWSRSCIACTTKPCSVANAITRIVCPAHRLPATSNCSSDRTPYQTNCTNMPNKIRVLVIDDSALMRAMLCEMINAAPDMEAVGRRRMRKARVK